MRFDGATLGAYCGGMDGLSEQLFTARMKARGTRPLGKTEGVVRLATLGVIAAFFILKLSKL